MTDFDQIQTWLKDLTALVSPSDEVRQEIREFVDVGEYGLALEWAGIGIFDDGRQASPTEVILFRRIAEAMSQDASFLLSEARRRAAIPGTSPRDLGP